MKLPFIHSTIAGLAITDTEVVWVSGMRRGSRLRRLEGTHEAVENGDVQAALARLVERVRPRAPYVATHLDPVHVRYVIVQGPALDDEAGFATWLENEAARQLPPGASPDDFAIRIQVLEEADGATRCLLALTRREAVEQRRALLETVDLQPLGIGGLDVTCSAALWLNPQFAEGRSAVLRPGRDDAVLIHYRDGVLRSIASLTFGTATTAALLEEVATHMTPAPDRLFVIGAEAAACIAQMRTVHLLACPLHEDIVDPRPYGGASPMAAGYTPAAALALEHLFSARGALNFLEPEAVSEQLQEIEKQGAMQATLILGSVLGALYLLVAFLAAYLGGKQAAAEATLDTLAGQVMQVEESRQAVTRLERDVAQAKRLVIERTRVAGVLEGVGRGTPDGLWLEVLALEAGALEPPHLTLRGMAYREGDVASYLNYLERRPFAKSVQLLYAEAIRARALYRQVNVQNRSLTRFEIQLALPSRPIHEEMTP